jgi:hypothetical protein
MTRPPERRSSGRIPRRLWVDIQLKKDRRRVKALDISRHGLFLEMDEAPELGRIVLLKVHLPGGPFEAMATVAHRAGWTVETMPGAGMKLYCLATAAKQRWDRFVADAGGEAFHAQPRASAGAASFLVQLESRDALRAFFEKHVSKRQLVYVSPPIRKLGAEVLVVLVHPKTQEEFALRGVVEDLDPDRPLRMGVRFDEDGLIVRRRFDTFLASGAPDDDAGQREAEGVTEYMIVSPTPNPDGTLPPEVVVGELLDREELEHIERKALFDFNWWADDETARS